MIDIELLKLQKEHLQSLLQRIGRELKDCHTGYILVDHEDEDCFSGIIRLFDEILNNNEDV